MVRFTAQLIVEDVVYLSGCGFALWKGGRPERLVAMAMVLELVVGTGLRSIERLEDPRYISLALDFAVLLSVLYAAFTSRWKWPLVASALQILSVLAYITRIIDPSIHSWAYVTVNIALGYGLLAALIYGTVTHIRRR